MKIIYYIDCGASMSSKIAQTEHKYLEKNKLKNPNQTIVSNLLTKTDN
jgi:hypothetical protein